LPGGIRFAFRHFPLFEKHLHAFAAAAAAEAAALQGGFWQMHDRLYVGQPALEDDDPRRYAAEVGLDLERFDRDRASRAVRERVYSDVASGTETNEIDGAPTLFIDGVVYRGSYEAAALVAALAPEQE
jgi:protein-disulfide isomerase